VKNCADAPIFHTAICAGAPQIALMAEQKLHTQLSVRPVALNALRNGGYYDTEKTSGVFSFGRNAGSAYSNFTFRPVLVEN